MPLQRRDFQRLARQRLREARVLLRAGCPDGAYHFAGLAVECALKACIAKRTRKYDFPDKNLVVRSWDHDLSKLLDVAGLSTILERDRRDQPHLDTNWGVVKDWRIESRYDQVSRQMAADLYVAVAARTNGILTWIRRHW